MRGCKAEAVGLSLSRKLHVMAEVAVTHPSVIQLCSSYSTVTALENDRTVPRANWAGSKAAVTCAVPIPCRETLDKVPAERVLPQFPCHTVNTGCGADESLMTS